MVPHLGVGPVADAWVDLLEVGVLLDVMLRERDAKHAWADLFHRDHGRDQAGRRRS